MFESVSEAIAFKIPTKLPSPDSISPNPATKPCVFNKEEIAVVVRDTFVSSSAAPAMLNKSGPVPEKRVIPICMLSSSSQVKIASTPCDLAALSDKSTTIASTKTWALLISSLAIIFFIAFKFSSAEEIIREFVFS